MTANEAITLKHESTKKYVADHIEEELEKVFKQIRSAAMNRKDEIKEPFIDCDDNEWIDPALKRAVIQKLRKLEYNVTYNGTNQLMIRW